MESERVILEDKLLQEQRRLDQVKRNAKKETTAEYRRRATEAMAELIALDIDTAEVTLSKLQAEQRKQQH